MSIKQKYKLRVVWLVMLGLVALTRFPFVNWDDTIAAHPDERYIISVAQDTPLFTNPAKISPTYAYGQFPLTVAQLVCLISPTSDPLLVLRMLAALLSVLVVAVTVRLALTVGNWWTAIIAGVTITFAPLLLQHGHYYTVDLWATFFGTLALLALLKRRWTIGGIMAGLALSSKISMVWAVFPLMLSIEFIGNPYQRYSLKTWLKSRRLWRFTLTMLVCFVVTSPWYVLQPGISWSGPYAQSWIVSGRLPVPFTMQYEHTLPWLYPLWQMALWGLGGLPTFVGLLSVIVVWGRFRQSHPQVKRVVLLVTVYFIGTGGLFVKFPRYLLPIYPAWSVLAGLILSRKTKSRPATRLRAVTGILLVLLQMLIGLAQVNMYRQPHPWTMASQWLFDNVALSKELAIEPNDHPLPVNTLSADTYRQFTIPLDDAGEGQTRTMLSELTASHKVIVISSRRNFAAQCQHDCASEIMTWYRRAFTDRDVLIFTRCPAIFGVAITDDPYRDADLPITQSLAEMCGTRYAIRLPKLDESYRVYDTPTAAILLPGGFPCRD